MSNDDRVESFERSDLARCWTCISALRFSQLNRRHSPVRDRSAFTLIELLIVVVILGILAAIVISIFPDTTSAARVNQTAVQMKSLAETLRRYHVYDGGWPADAGAGVFPPELRDFLSSNSFSVKVPIGGRYDWNNSWGTFDYSIGIQDPGMDLGVWQEVDLLLDDGDLSTGIVVRHLNSLLLKVE